MDMQAVLGELFSNAKIVGLEGIIQFAFGEDAGLWFDLVADAAIRTGFGTHGNADVCLEISIFNLQGILDGTLNIEDLFASGDLLVHGDFGVATLLPQLIDIALRGGERQEFKANRRYPARPRASDRLSASQLPLMSVARRARTDLSVADFREHYMRPGIPVVITDAIQDWPLFTAGRQRVNALFSGLQGISRHGNYASKAFSIERDFRSTSICDYLASLDTLACEGDAQLPPAYMGNNILPSKMLEYIRYPSYFEREQYIRPRLWIGPKGTVTPLHRDDSDNLFAQVWGSKHVILAAPHHREALGAWSASSDGGLEGCDVDPKAPDTERFPKVRSVRFLDVVLKAGEILFLPEGWFHQVESLSTSLSVNFWVDSGRGWKYSPLPDGDGTITAVT